MKTMSAFDLPATGRTAPARRAAPAFATLEDEKLRVADLLRVVAEVSSALAACGLLNWVAT